MRFLNEIEEAFLMFIFFFYHCFKKKMFELVLYHWLGFFADIL